MAQPAGRASNNPDVAEAAADGWLWGLSPFEDVMLVHAVDRPLEAPRPIRLTPIPDGGRTHVHLLGAIDLHGPSTDSLTAEATGSTASTTCRAARQDLSPTSADAFRTQCGRTRTWRCWPTRMSKLTRARAARSVATQRAPRIRDTRHRRVDYRFRASTRFREYFRPRCWPARRSDNPLDDGQSVIGPVVQVSVPSSARPAAPIVHSVIPLFRWSDATEPEQPMSRRHGRRAGVRIYLERPWFSSGNGELLGVLLARGGDDNFGPPTEDQSGFPFVSKWGADPDLAGARRSRSRACRSCSWTIYCIALGFDDRVGQARPSRSACNCPW